jgi:hypothetical protein
VSIVPFKALKLQPYGLQVTIATLLFGLSFRDQQPGQRDNRDYTDDYHNQHDFQQREAFVPSQKSHHFLLPP